MPGTASGFPMIDRLSFYFFKDPIAAHFIAASTINYHIDV